jgi:endonuclease/exonuclease/phosphatase family metal-dependent hydrolase
MALLGRRFGGSASAETGNPLAKLRRQSIVGDRDVILVGDFNRNVGDDSFDDLLALEGLRCANAGTGPTKIDNTNTYDQIFLSLIQTKEWKEQFDAAPFDETDFGNDDTKARVAVSDHRPVWITLEVPASDDD